MKITFFKNKESRIGYVKDITIQELYNIVSNFKLINKDEQQCYIAGTLDKNNRGSSYSMLTRSMITLDIDKTNMSIDELSEKITDTHIIYTTYSNSDTIHSYRVLIPLNAEIAADNYNTIATNYATKFENVDPSSYKPKQLMFFGGAKNPNNAESRIVIKTLFNPEHKQVKNVLSTLDANDYDLWIRTGIALYNSYGDEGFTLFNEWSKTADNYGRVEEKWESFKTNTDKKRFVCSIFYDAKVEYKLPTIEFDTVEANSEYKYLGGTAELFEKYYGEEFNLRMNAIISELKDWRFLFSKFIKEECGVKLTYKDKKVTKTILISFEKGKYEVVIKTNDEISYKKSYDHLFDVFVKHGQLYPNVLTKLPVVDDQIEDFLLGGIPLQYNSTLLNNYELDCNNYFMRIKHSFEVLGLYITLDYIQSGAIFINGKIPKLDNTVIRSTLKNKIKIETGIVEFDEYYNSILQTQKTNAFVNMIKLKPWDGVNRVDEFIDSFKVKSDQYDDFKYFMPRYLSQLFCLHMDDEIWEDYKLNYYRKYNRNIIAKAEAVLILIGGQGLSKSTAISAFLPHNMNKYIGSQYIDFKGGNAVDRFKVDYLICELGEIDVFISKNAEEFKNFLSQSEMRGREAYAKDPVLLKRKSLFYGTSNHRSILKDITGSRRFLCIDIDETLNIKHKDKFMQQLWAELYHKVLNFEITPFVDKVFNQTDYRYISVTEEDILEHFEVSNYKEGKALSERQVFRKIAPFDLKFDDTIKGKITRALISLNAPIKKQNGNILYWLKEKTK